MPFYSPRPDNKMNSPLLPSQSGSWGNGPNAALWASRIASFGGWGNVQAARSGPAGGGPNSRGYFPLPPRPLFPNPYLAPLGSGGPAMGFGPPQGMGGMGYFNPYI